MDTLKDELRGYYYAHSRREPEAQAMAGRIAELMDAYAAAHPEESTYLLKAQLHETLAAEFEPVIFAHSPFYWEMGLKESESWGVPFDPYNAAAWLFKRRSHLFGDHNPRNLRIRNLRERLGISDFYGIFPDSDHTCFGAGVVFRQGLAGLYERAVAAADGCRTADEADFIAAVQRSLLAVRAIGAKFAAAAAARVATAPDDTARRFLTLIADTAGRVPWQPPASFYEGLATLWFLREVCSSIEGIGVSVIGHVDRLLGDLYRRDVAAGVLTREGALDLVERWLLPTDHKKDFYTADFQETSTTLVLGGCDERGEVVCNEVTFLVLEAHERHHLMNPKLNCRYGSGSPAAYLDEINRQLLAGRNVFALFNDDCLVPAQVRAGKRLEDARRYVAGGCHEPILEGLEHSAGAACYIHLPRLLELAIHEHPELREDLAATELTIRRLDGAPSFAELYDRVLQTIADACRQTAELIACNGSVWPQVNPAPFFSSSLAGCLEQRRDYTAGGARYSPTALPMVGFANLLDSLYALKRLCFDEGRYALSDVLDAVRADWQGHDRLLHEVLALPKYGDDDPAVNALAQRLFDDLAAIPEGLLNERGGPFQLSFFAYYHNYLTRAKQAAATPDGRRAGEVFSHGISPRNLHRAVPVTAVINSLAGLDLQHCAANAILDLQLPLAKLTSAHLTALERAFAASGGATCQMNCVDERTLRAAQEHPEQYRDLTVRVCGMSARFVALPVEMQNEMIRRNQYAM